MQVNEILIEIDREIERLQQARDLLAGSTSKRGGRRSAAATPQTKKRGKRKLSEEGRRRISEALKRRWAERKRALAKAAK